VKFVGLRIAVTSVVVILLNLLVRSAFTIHALHTDVHGVGAYLGVLGGLYSIVVAFLIYVVWEQYNRVQIGVAKEASSLEDLCRVAVFLSDRGMASSVRGAVRKYMEGTQATSLAASRMGN
jgi:hypothetical protein